MKKINILRLFLIICSVTSFLILCHYGEIVQSMVGTPKFHDPPYGEYAQALFNQELSVDFFVGFLFITALSFIIPSMLKKGNFS